MRVRSGLLVAAVVAMVAPMATAPAGIAQEPTGDYQQVLDITYPTRPDAGLSDTYDACRDGCARVHKAADLMGEKMWPLYAAVDGQVCGIDDGEEDHHGRHLTLCGDDGRRYRYLHLNNDTPGTDDGAAGLEHVYAPGVRKGLRVARGQLVAYMGDSGNSEDTGPHLHFDIFDDDVVDPYGDNRINPYPSLMSALARGDVADGSVVHSDPVSRVAGGTRVETAIELARRLPVGSDTVLIARADDPTDALVAGPLAGVLQAPVLITPPDTLDPRVLEEVRRRKASHAIVVGVEPSTRVVDALRGAGLEVERLAGGDRFETADVVAEAVWAATGADDGVEVADDEGHVEGDTIPDDLADLGATLVVHPTADRAGGVLVDGATVAGQIAVELVADDDLGSIDDVTFTIDGHEVGTERMAPYDMLGTGRGDRPRRLDTREFDNGQYLVEAVVDLRGQPDHHVEASMTVANGQGRSALLALGEHSVPSRQWPDAMVGSYLGAATQRPVLLTGPVRLPPSTVSLLDTVIDLTVIGGPVAIPEDVLADLDVTPRRLAGADRYATSVVVVDELIGRGLVDIDRTWAATGVNWPDAITAGPVIAGLGDALVLIDGSGGGSGTSSSSWMRQRAASMSSGRVIGGPHAVVDRAVTAFSLDLT